MPYPAVLIRPAGAVGAVFTSLETGRSRTNRLVAAVAAICTNAGAIAASPFR